MEKDLSHGGSYVEQAAQLEQEIERKRNELNRSVNDPGDLLSKDVLDKSQELDSLLNQYRKLLIRHRW
jgi:hypothetical protein